MDDLPLDFTEYVSQRLGLPEEETKRLLTEWLRNYEPTSRRALRPLVRTRDLGEDESGLPFRKAG